MSNNGRLKTALIRVWEVMNTPIFSGLESDGGPLRRLRRTTRKRVIRIGTAVVLGACVGLVGRISIGPALEDRFVSHVVAQQLREQSPAMAILADEFPSEFDRVAHAMKAGIQSDRPAWRIQEEIGTVMNAVQKDLYPLLEGASDAAIKDFLISTQTVFANVSQLQAYQACHDMMKRDGNPPSMILASLIKTEIDNQTAMLFRAVENGRGNAKKDRATLSDWHAVERAVETRGGSMSFPVMIQNNSSFINKQSLCEDATQFLDILVDIDTEQAVRVRLDLAMAISGGQPLAYTNPYDIEI